MRTYKLNNLHIPDTWDGVDDFCDWYMNNNMPINMVDSAEVFLSDDATAFCMFRHGQFQVEAYLIYPNPKVPIHEHPNVDVIKVRLYKEDAGGVRAECSNTLTKGKSHGVGARMNAETKGFVLYAVQHWKTECTPTTVAARWKGRTVGPMQEALIRRFNPNALIINGYADVTQTMDYLKELQNAKSA
jgi:hypothetical protein